VDRSHPRSVTGSPFVGQFVKSIQIRRAWNLIRVTVGYLSGVERNRQFTDRRDHRIPTVEGSLTDHDLRFQIEPKVPRVVRIGCMSARAAVPLALRDVDCRETRGWIVLGVEHVRSVGHHDPRSFLAPEIPRLRELVK
jgi:hypothetical protein